MNCPHCANAVPDGSKFCNHCGLAPEATAKSNRGGTMFLAGLLLAGAVAGIFYAIQPRTPSGSVHAAQPVLQPHTQPILDTAFTIESGKLTAYKFEVPAGATNVKVTGHFAASGGMKNSIEVFLTNADGVGNLQNHNPYKHFYASGRVTQDTINVPLPSTADTYYLVFDNRFALLIPRAVKADAAVSYTQQAQVGQP